MFVSELLGNVVSWAAEDASVVGVALVGSHARGVARSDSDVDLVILTLDLRPYLEDTGWLERFGTVTSCKTEDWGPVTSLRVFFEGGLEVEFGLTTTVWAELPVDAGTRRVVSAGMRVLYDSEDVLGRLQQAVTA